MSDALPLPREAHRDRGKVLDEAGARADEGLGPLQGRGRRRHPLPHAARHARRRQGRLLHARLGPRRVRALHRERPAPTCATWTAWRGSSRRRAALLPGARRRRRRARQVGHPRLRHHALRRRRGARPAARRARTRDRLPAPPGLPLRRRGRRVHRARTTASTWSSRTATRRCSSCCAWTAPSVAAQLRERPATTTACRIDARSVTDAIAAQEKAASQRRACERGARMSTRPAATARRARRGPKANRLGLPDRRLQGRQVHAVRRLRPRRHHEHDHLGASARWASSRTASPRCRASAARRRRRPTS